MSLAHGMEVLLSDQNPLLPSALAMRVYLRFSWVVVQSVCALWVMRRVLPRLDIRRSKWVCFAVVGTLLYFNLSPGGLSPAYWLGLAFNAPALMSLFLCSLYWKRPDAKLAPVSPSARRWSLVFVLGGVVLGYVLLLDLLAMLPVQLYAWGFSPMALVVMMALSLAPCVALNPMQRGNRWTFFLPLSLLLFVATRLPTGNVWDVVLDPLLWVALQVHVVIRVWRRA